MKRADIVALFKQAGVRRLKQGRRMLSPDSVRLSYFKALRGGILYDMRAGVEAKLIPALHRFVRSDGARVDAGGDSIGEILDKLSDELFRKWTNARIAQLVKPVAYDTSQWSRKQTAAIFRDYIGIDVLGLEPWLAKEVDAFVAENVALIKSIPTQYHDDLERRTTRAVADGDRWESIADDVRARYGVSESRANLIARDQVGKFYGDLNRIRQTELGVDRYTWRTMHDNRVRDEHEALDGKVFSWSEEPEPDGHPGEGIQCRCWADPDMSGILKEALGEAAPGSLGETLPGEVARETAGEVKFQPAPVPAAPPVDPDPVVLEPPPREPIALIQNPANWHALNPPAPTPEPEPKPLPPGSLAFLLKGGTVPEAEPSTPEPKAKKEKGPVATPNYPDPGVHGESSPEFHAASRKLLDSTRAQIRAEGGDAVVEPLYDYTVNSTRMNAFAAGSYDPSKDPDARTLGRERVEAQIAKRIAELDAAIAKVKITEDVTTYRAIEAKTIADALPKKLGITSEQLSDVAKGYSVETSVLQKLVGVAYTDPVFASTSLEPSVASGFMAGRERVLVRVSIPKGMPGAFFNGDSTLTRFTSEHELLLPRGCRFQITGVTEFAGRPVLEVSVKKPRAPRKSQASGGD